MAEVEKLQRRLLDAQNADGGWGYGRSSSWTEPTAFALLALASYGIRNDAYERGCLWLLQSQRADGGWPPNLSVNVSTWVTAIAALALSRGGQPLASPCDQAIEWLVHQARPEFTPVERLALRLIGGTTPVRAGGFSWFPGTAAWIAPTAISILALSQRLDKNNDPKLRALVRDAQQYILCHRCRDGGWNHGGSRYLSENAFSYPETTGMALLALYAIPAQELALPLKLAEAWLSSASSVEAASWLNLALTRHGRGVKNTGSNLPCRTTRDISLLLLSLAASSSSNGLMTAFA